MADFLAMIEQATKKPTLDEHGILTFEFDASSVKQAHDEVEGCFGEEEAQCQNQMKGGKQAVEEMGKVGESLGRSAAWGAGQAASGGSLPNQFQKTILNHYMPGQEKYLMELAEILMFDNMGAGIGNSLLTIITDFSAAATNYDFSGSLAGGGKGNESPTKAKNQLNNETKQAHRDLEKLKEAIAKLDKEIKKIQNDKNLTASQKKEMIGKLTKIKANLNVAKGQVSKLYKLLKQLHIHKGKDGNHFTVTGPKGWETALGTDEGQVINGGKGKPPGGLVNISADISLFQQTYSDQGQNQQMMLQMRMTEIQQEWTVVSTALQPLNQMYMGIAQGIYK